MNILFVNYGDFTTNSLNHIGGFANRLCAEGHSCVVAINGDLKTLAVVPSPVFVPATYATVLENPALFPDNRPADIVHAWTPRECVRKFVLAYQPKAHARLIVHLEDNEEFLTAQWLHTQPEALAGMSEISLREKLAPALSHPRRYPHLLAAADGVTVIVDALRRFVPASVATHLLPPGVDFSLYQPRNADAALRAELGLEDHEKVLVFTGSNTFANEGEIRDLYLAVSLLNQQGVPTRLIRTGFSPEAFKQNLPAELTRSVVDLGFVEKARLPQLLALADVLVQPGHRGPFNDFRLPSKLPEFLAAGKPVVTPATNIGAELRDGIDAVLLNSGSPEEIAAACVRIFKDPKLARQLGENAASFARRHFDLAKNTAELAAFYNALAAAPARPGSTAAMKPEQTELSLSLDRLARETTDPKAAALASNLSPLIAAVDSGAVAEDICRRLEHEAGEWRKRGTAAEERQKLTEQHANNLTRELTDARGRLQRLEGKYAISEKLLASTRRQLDATDRELSAAQHQIAQLEDVKRMTAQHARNLENLRDSLERRIRELDDQCGHLTNTIRRVENEVRHRDEVVAAREAKIRTLESSFSWQVTMPLRWLRRKLIDSRRPRPKVVTAPVEVAPVTIPIEPPTSRPDPNPADAPGPQLESEARPKGPDFVYSVDNPQSWSMPPRATVVRGWCFRKDGGKIVGVRAVLHDRTIAGTYGFRRLDVLASFRGSPQAEDCGWKFSIAFTVEDKHLRLEAGGEDGAWNPFFETPLRIGEGLGPVDLTRYEKWAEVYDSHTTDSLLDQAAKAGSFAFRPLISVLMPTYNTPATWLGKAIASVRAQSYPHWELCIADDASTEPHVRPQLEAAAAQDKRIKVVFRPANGHISAASNSALETATGEFIALLDHDDELAPNALFEVASALNARPDTDFLYSDEDKIDEDGRRFEPYFKPDWLPDLFVGQNYTSHLSVYRASLVRAAGGFRIGYEGSQDWDLGLRVAEQTSADRILHIPKVLYHWRAIPGSTALQLQEKNYPVEAARRALQDHFQRIGENIALVPVPGDHWRVKRGLPEPAPRVALIIPTRNGLRILRRCVESIRAKTAYPNYEIVVVDNGSDDPETLRYLEDLQLTSSEEQAGNAPVRVLPYPGEFNYSAINNHAVARTEADIVGLLNNDLEVIHADWLAEMVSHAVRPEIGCVGAMLYYPNDTIQHAGVVLGLGGVAGHAFREYPRGTEGKFNRARLVQNYSAVTAACLLVRRSVYEQVGGLDEQALRVAFNDIDFCLKVGEAGYRNLWTPFAELYHHESATRGADDTPEKAERFQAEVEMMLRRWGPVLQNDPAYNPNLSLELTDFSLASPPRPALPCRARVGLVSRAGSSSVARPTEDAPHPASGPDTSARSPSAVQEPAKP